jgi:hypothetical protein
VSFYISGVVGHFFIDIFHRPANFAPHARPEMPIWAANLLISAQEQIFRRPETELSSPARPPTLYLQAFEWLSTKYIDRKVGCGRSPLTRLSPLQTAESERESSEVVPGSFRPKARDVHEEHAHPVGHASGLSITGPAADSQVSEGQKPIWAGLRRASPFS